MSKLERLKALLAETSNPAATTKNAIPKNEDYIEHLKVEIGALEVIDALHGATPVWEYEGTTWTFSQGTVEDDNENGDKLFMQATGGDQTFQMQYLKKRSPPFEFIVYALVNRIIDATNKGK